MMTWKVPRPDLDQSLKLDAQYGPALMAQAQLWAVAEGSRPGDGRRGQGDRDRSRNSFAFVERGIFKNTT